MKKLLSPSELLRLVKESSHLTRIEYYHGSLVTDISKSGPIRLPAWKLLCMCQSMSSFDAVILVQKRMAEDNCTYYAVRTSKPMLPILDAVARDLEGIDKVKKPSPWWQSGTV